MNRFSFYLLLSLVSILPLSALSQALKDTVVQKKDSVPSAARRNVDTGSLILPVDTVRITSTDSLSGKDSLAAPLPPPPKPTIPYDVLLKSNPYFNFLGKPVVQIAVDRSSMNKDSLFYLLAGMLFYFALIKVAFGKYLGNLFAVFFRVSLKQKQLREQLLQTPLPSLLLNVFFVLSGGLYITFLLQYYQFQSSLNFWWLFLYSVVGLTVVYAIKFTVLKLVGWVFNIKSATDTYVFVVFLVNKLLGVFLIPFLLLIAFASPDALPVLVTASIAVVAITFLYRYIISYAPVRKEIKVSQFHFFIYLCAFEITPLLLIYKILGLYWKRGL